MKKQQVAKCIGRLKDWNSANKYLKTKQDEANCEGKLPRNVTTNMRSKCREKEREVKVKIVDG